MKLRVKDAAALLHVPEKTIYSLIEQGKLPVHQGAGQYRFSRVELLEWAMTNQVALSPQILEEPKGAAAAPSLEEALRAGGVHYQVKGADKAAVLRSIVNILPLPKEVDRQFLLQVLLARESLGSTAIGGGIAIPHVRNPITLRISQPLVGLCFLKKPIDFQSIDGLPVHTLFVIVSPNIEAHLKLLSKLSFGLRSTPFAEAVARIGSQEDLLNAAARLDTQIACMTPVPVPAPKDRAS